VRLEPEQLAWLLLLSVDRMQAKGSTVRLIVPSDPEVARALDPALSEHEILSAENYLLDRGYIAPANIGLTWGTYTITSAGLGWLDEGFPWPSEASRVATEEPGELAAPRPATLGAHVGSQRRSVSWWRRLFERRLWLRRRSGTRRWKAGRMLGR
jgi:hypothetical protein